MFAAERASAKLLLHADVRNKKARIYIDARLGRKSRAEARPTGA
jgi:hypothetical protein